ncbi:Uncharacterised protein [Bacillus freudenreichii]|nr:Uncharacterised protein [Bacillus freudenreichii]
MRKLFRTSACFEKLKEGINIDRFFYSTRDSLCPVLGAIGSRSQITRNLAQEVVLLRHILYSEAYISLDVILYEVIIVRCFSMVAEVPSP